MGVIYLLAANPKHDIGATLDYYDHTMRRQVGKVLRVEAYWSGYDKTVDKETAHIAYTVTHPTYRRKRICISDRNIIGEVTP